MHPAEQEPPFLSICMTCRDGREYLHDGVRGGTRLAEAVVARPKAKSGGLTLRVRGIHCISQCKRPCAIALSAPDRFTYVFGDLDPGKSGHIEALLTLSSLYLQMPEGFLRREDRPTPLRTNILGRIPPLTTASKLVTPLFQEVAR